MHQTTEQEEKTHSPPAPSRARVRHCFRAHQARVQVQARARHQVVSEERLETLLEGEEDENDEEDEEAEQPLQSGDEHEEELIEEDVPFWENLPKPDIPLWEAQWRALAAPALALAAPALAAPVLPAVTPERLRRRTATTTSSKMKRKRQKQSVYVKIKKCMYKGVPKQVFSRFGWEERPAPMRFGDAMKALGLEVNGEDLKR